MMNLFRSELFRVRKRTQSWSLLVILVALEVLLYGIMVIVNFASSDPTNVKENIQLPKIYDTGLIIVGLAGTILAIIFGSSILGSEYGWNTLRPMLARAKSRSSFLTAKWLTVGTLHAGSGGCGSCRDDAGIRGGLADCRRRGGRQWLDVC